MATSETATHPDINVNVPLSYDLHRQLKMVAASEGMTIKGAVRKAIEHWVNEK